MPGVDLPCRARELARAHDMFLSHQRRSPEVRNLVTRSWARMVELGLDPDSPNGRQQPAEDELARRRQTSPLAEVIDDLKGVLTSVADAALFLMVVTDADGLVLWREGSAKVRMAADDLGFVEGVPWTERAVGTNAIGTALSEAAPVELFAAEHFEHKQHPWYCTAHPIHDPSTGALLGVVDVSGPALTLHPAIGALVETGARLAEASLLQRHREGLDRLRQSTEPIVGAGPLLVVDDHGWVAHHPGIAARDRIAAPNEGVALAVPGLGLCLPERLEAGWLVRPVTGHEPITAKLVGSVLVVNAGDSNWRVALSPRHVLIVSLLHRAGPGGLTARQLSRAVFGDDQHVVTARAEVSRLRRQIGALIATNPFRIAEGVVLGVEGALQPSR